MENRWHKIEKIFYEAARLPAAERVPFVEQVTKNDLILREEVISLLTEDALDDGFLSDPVFTLGVQILDADGAAQLENTDFAHYKIKRFLGRGGMGSVYLAEDKRLERPAALKFLPSILGETDNGVERFRREAKTASSISHPNIAHIYDFGQHDERYFLAMEYVPGKTLRQLLKEKTIDFKQSVEILLQIAAALRAAHEAGIIHRDVKPENVVLRDDGLVKVLDFGLAKLRGEEPDLAASNLTEAPADSLATNAGAILGTAVYMSPEQVRTEPLDLRTDIWSLGVIFYEMLVGKRPFAGDDLTELQNAILQQQPNIPRYKTGDPVRAKAFAIVEKCLQKSRAERYNNVAELIADLRPLQKIIAESPDESEAVTKKNGEFWGASWLSAGILLVLTSVFVASIWLFWMRKEPPHSSPVKTVRQMTRLTNSGSAVRASVSPNGEMLAYILEEAGMRNLHLRRRNTETGDFSAASVTLVAAPFEERISSSTFTPDNRFIYFRRQKPGETIFSLYKIPVEGGEPVFILADLVTPPGFSPDGRQMVFVRRSADQSSDSIIVADDNGANERILYTRRMPDFIPGTASPAWSPDGQTIICSAATRAENQEKMFVTAINVQDGTSRPAINETWDEIWATDWFGDGKGFVMTGHKDSRIDNNQLYAVSYPDGEISRLTDDFNDYYTLSIARKIEDSTNVQLTSVVLKRTAQLWRVDLNNASANPQALTSVGGDDGYGVSWQRRGGRVFYGSMTAGNPDIWTMKPDGTERRQLTNDKDLDSQPSATVDNRFIVFGSLRSGIESLWRMDAADGGNQILLASNAAREPLAVTPDSKFVYYHSTSDGAAGMWRVAIEGGQPPEKVAAGNYYPSAFSPDGKLLAAGFRAQDAKEHFIVLLSLDEGGVKIVKQFKPIDGTEFPDWIRWSPDGKTLVLNATRKGVGNLFAQPVAGGSPKQLTNFAASRIYSFDFSPDGKQIICARGELFGYVTLIQVQ